MLAGAWNTENINRHSYWAQFWSYKELCVLVAGATLGGGVGKTWWVCILIPKSTLYKKHCSCICVLHFAPPLCHFLQNKQFIWITKSN
ncbi:hypothetical protein XELAEV_18005368mg [Xenopus laevis]|uniref:Uncharacterized protein n=1 Tax=Xenopus laevis TaxID=8355 RepID=A0A974I3A8_XENLA|nr:hypothetical protein XELAEV_18005368mg [Xenopus laevis]